MARWLIGASRLWEPSLCHACTDEKLPTKACATISPMAIFRSPSSKPRAASHPDGHFYSPVVDPDELAGQRGRLWPDDPEILGVDFNDASHQRILKQVFPRYMPDYDYVERPAGRARDSAGEEEDDDRFYTQNSQFSWLDARALFVLLREWRPARVIEVGSGYSSLLMADVNRRFFEGSCRSPASSPTRVRSCGAVCPASRASKSPRSRICR